MRDESEVEEKSLSNTPLIPKSRVFNKAALLATVLDKNKYPDRASIQVEDSHFPR